jgi:hypothetical protein
MRTARPFALAAVTLAVAALSVAGGANSSTALEDGDKCAAWSDLNGDGVGDDTWVGDPDATAGGKAKAGAVWIRPANETGGFGTAIRVIQGTHGVPGAPGTGDRFGAAITGSIDLNDDGCFDLVVAAPGESRGGHAGAGSVSVIFGSPAGLGKGIASLVLSATTTGDTPQTDEHFGSALAADADAELFESTAGVLAVGRPGKNVDGAAAAGAVDLFRFGSSGEIDQKIRITQNFQYVGGHPEKGDRFGSALDFYGDFYGDTLFVGVPGENDSKGIVQPLSGSHDNWSAPIFGGGGWSLDSRDVPGTAKAGDRFGAALTISPAMTAIGVPGRDVGSATDAGAILVTRHHMSLSNSVLVSQNTKDASGHAVAGTAETGDRFGSVIMGEDGFMVGIPGEDVSGHKDAGAVWMMGDLPNVGREDRVLTQGTPGVPGAVQTGNRFGAALSHRQVSFSIGVPGDQSHPHGSVIRLNQAFLSGVQTTDVEQWSPPSGVSAGAAL